MSAGTLALSGGSLTSSDLFIGKAGYGILNLTNGYLSNSLAYIGYESGGTGVANVSGGSWENTVQLIVGDSGTGTLNLTGGNVLSGEYSYIGFVAGSTGVANVSGGTWEIVDGTYDGELFIGVSGNGSLNLTGGNVSVDGGIGNVSIATLNGSVGTLNLGTGTTVGNLNAGSITGGNGTAVVNFNHTGNYTFDPILAVSLSVNKLGSGTTILTGNNTYTGATAISAGTLEITSTGLLGGGNYTDIT